MPARFSCLFTFLKLLPFVFPRTKTDAISYIVNTDFTITTDTDCPKFYPWVIKSLSFFLSMSDSTAALYY